MDIEGLAATDKALFIGFRGPVLRGNLVPILRIGHDLSRASARNSEVLFVELGGRGIRDMAPGPGGLYILAGPNGDEPQSFAVYLWNKSDQVAGPDRKAPASNLRCDLGTYDASSKPEGLAYVDRSGDDLRFVLIFDGDAPPKAQVLILRSEE